MRNTKHGERVQAADPIQKAWREQRAFSLRWLGSVKQTPLQRVGFGMVSLFLALVGGVIWRDFFSSPSRENVILVGFGAVPPAVGLAGIAKALQKPS
jgi:hypothetical protein